MNKTINRPESVFELLESEASTDKIARVDRGRGGSFDIKFSSVPPGLQIKLVSEPERDRRQSLSSGESSPDNAQATILPESERQTEDKYKSVAPVSDTIFRLDLSQLQEPISFANHIRNRAKVLANLFPFPHHYQNVLSAIANIDWQVEYDPLRVNDSLTYLWMAGVSSDATAIAYLDWLEPRLRHKLIEYELMLDLHQRQIDRFVREFKI
jgi:hypothetical protein